MEKRVQKALSSLVLTTIVLVSVVSVCKQMFMVCGFDCAGQSMSMMDHAHQNMGTDHMASFASVHPSTMPDAFSTLFVACAVFVALWVFSIKDHLIDAERLTAKTRCCIRNLAQSFTPSFFVLAFSKGILHSKIYA